MSADDKLLIFLKILPSMQSIKILHQLTIIAHMVKWADN